MYPRVPSSEDYVPYGHSMIASEIITHAKRHLDEMLLTLKPTATIEPIVVVDGPLGMKRVDLHDPDDEDFPETVRLIVPAFLVASEAVEVAILRFFNDDAVDVAGPKEVAVISHWHPVGQYRHSADLIRRTTQPPVLGHWKGRREAMFVGDTADGVRSGLEMVSRLCSSEHRAMQIRLDAIRDRASDSDIIPEVLDVLIGNRWI